MYDTGNPKEPNKAAWFKLERRDSRWTTNRDERCYDAEHVLEWQMLSRFIEADSNLGKDSRCAYLHKFFEIGINKGEYKVKAAKNEGKLGANDRAEYDDVDYDFAKWKVKSQPFRAIDYVCKCASGLNFNVERRSVG